MGNSALLCTEESAPDTGMAAEIEVELSRMFIPEIDFKVRTPSNFTNSFFEFLSSPGDVKPTICACCNAIYNLLLKAMLIVLQTM